MGEKAIWIFNLTAEKCFTLLLTKLIGFALFKLCQAKREFIGFSLIWKSDCQRGGPGLGKEEWRSLQQKKKRGLFMLDLFQSAGAKFRNRIVSATPRHWRAARPEATPAVPSFQGSAVQWTHAETLWCARSLLLCCSAGATEQSTSRPQYQGSFSRLLEDNCPWAVTSVPCKVQEPHSSVPESRWECALHYMETPRSCIKPSKPKPLGGPQESAMKTAHQRMVMNATCWAKWPCEWRCRKMKRNRIHCLRSLWL